MWRGGPEERGGSPCGSIDRSIDGVPLPLSLSVASWLEEEGQKERGKKRDESTSKRYRLTNWDRRRRREGGGSPEGSPRCTIISFADRTLPRVNLLVG